MMNTLPMLVSLIETAIKEKTVEIMYDDFLEEALKMGLSSYTLNVLIVNAKTNLEKSESSNNDDLINPFVYRYDIIKPSPEIIYEYVTQEKIIRKNKKGFGYIVSAMLILLINIGIIVLYGREVITKERKIEKQIERTKRRYIKSDISKIIDYSTRTLSSWQSTNNIDNSESHMDYIFNVKSGDELSFKYYVSSEAKYDVLDVFLFFPSDTTNLISKSGSDSGEKTYKFDKDGSVTIRFQYTKDNTISNDEDVAKVTDIIIRRPSDTTLNDIKQYLNNN